MRARRRGPLLLVPRIRRTDRPIATRIDRRRERMLQDRPPPRAPVAVLRRDLVPLPFVFPFAPHERLDGRRRRARAGAPLTAPRRWNDGSRRFSRVRHRRERAPDAIDEYAPAPPRRTIRTPRDPHREPPRSAHEIPVERRHEIDVNGDPVDRAAEHARPEPPIRRRHASSHRITQHAPQLRTRHPTHPNRCPRRNDLPHDVPHAPPARRRLPPRARAPPTPPTFPHVRHGAPIPHPSDPVPRQDEPIPESAASPRSKTRTPPPADRTNLHRSAPNQVSGSARNQLDSAMIHGVDCDWIRRGCRASGSDFVRHRGALRTTARGCRSGTCA